MTKNPWFWHFTFLILTCERKINNFDLLARSLEVLSYVFLMKLVITRYILNTITRCVTMTCFKHYTMFWRTALKSSSYFGNLCKAPQILSRTWGIRHPQRDKHLNMSSKNRKKKQTSRWSCVRCTLLSKLWWWKHIEHITLSLQYIYTKTKKTQGISLQ